MGDMAKKCEHYWKPTAYFFGEEDDEEWLVLECEICRERKVIEGDDVRGCY